MSILNRVDDTNMPFTKQVDIKICKFANGECHCANRPRLCERVEVVATSIAELAMKEADKVATYAAVVKPRGSRDG